MKKEQVLDLLKDSVSTLRDKGKTFHENDPLRKAWEKQNKMFNDGVRTLNSCDMLWVNDEYAKWVKENFKNYLDELQKINVPKKSDWI